MRNKAIVVSRHRVEKYHNRFKKNQPDLESIFEFIRNSLNYNAIVCSRRLIADLQFGWSCPNWRSCHQDLSVCSKLVSRDHTPVWVCFCMVAEQQTTLINPTMHQTNIPQCTTHVHISVTNWSIVGYLSDALWVSWTTELKSIILHLVMQSITVNVFRHGILQS